MAYEDWTDESWTEVDTNGDLTVAANTIAISSMRQDADGCVYKDFGASYFGNFTNIEIDDFIEEATTDAHGNFTILGMSNNSSYLNWRDMWLNEEGWVVVKYKNPAAGVTSKVLIRACDGQDADDTIYTADHSTTYIDCRRNGTLLTVDIYTDSERTDLWDTLNVDDPAVDYRYCICGAAYHCVGCSYAASEVDGWVANLDLHEAIVKILRKGYIAGLKPARVAKVGRVGL